MNPRKFTIQKSYLNNNWSYKLVPQLTLKGLWLLKAGFKPGQKVAIEKVDKCLIIKPL